MSLHRQICMWLKSKGTPFEPGQFGVDFGPGGEVIKRWDDTLGRRPTAQDLAAFDPAVEALSSGWRHVRDQKLAATDWTMLLDAPLTNEQRALWAVYRKMLRDITEQPYFPQRVIWPELPPPITKS